MTKPNYEVFTFDDGLKAIKRTDIDGQIWFIPIDPANADYQAYLESLEA
jgi:hypothetical protein